MRVVVSGARQPELLLMLSSSLAPLRVEPGCLQARLYVDADNSCALTLVQEWERQQDLDRYLASDACKVVLAVLESSQRAPEVSFDTVATRAGLEVIEIARRAKVRGPRLI
jgi:quinol monooxygenase YgiN